MHFYPFNFSYTERGGVFYVAVFRFLSLFFATSLRSAYEVEVDRSMPKVLFWVLVLTIRLRCSSMSKDECFSLKSVQELSRRHYSLQDIHRNKMQTACSDQRMRTFSFQHHKLCYDEQMCVFRSLTYKTCCMLWMNNCFINIWNIPNQLVFKQGNHEFIRCQICDVWSC